MKSYIIKATLLCSSLFAIDNVNAQSIEKSVVASTGADTTVGGYNYVWTVGEAVIGSATPAGYIITEGFLPLSVDSSVSVNSIVTNKPSVKLYPNPLTDKLTLEVAQKEAKSLNVRVLDVSGRVISATETLPMNTSFSHRIDFKDLSSGTYFVILSHNKDVVFTSKVIKQ